MLGTLYLVGTPIGNLEDMTPRAVRILREAALIAAEDTRRTLKLLNHNGIKTPLLSYHAHNERERAPTILARLAAGESVALVTDAGMPGISDPGETLVARALAAGAPVVPVPGPSACLLALAASGLPAASFLFLGFLPLRPKQRRETLTRLAGESGTIILYEAPHRLPRTLTELAASLGGTRRVVVARELTKVHEEFWRGELAGALAHFTMNPPRGEFTLVLAGAGRREAPSPTLSAARVRVAQLMRSGSAMNEAVRVVAKEFGLARNLVYRACLRGYDESQEDVPPGI